MKTLKNIVAGAFQIELPEWVDYAAFGAICALCVALLGM